MQVPESTTADLLILGGGPAGLSTALHLHQLDPQLAARALILEKGRYPRPKLCAGGLAPDAEILLERLGLDVREVPHVDVQDIHFDFEARGLSLHSRGRHALRVIRRDEFDAWLAGKVRAAGIGIREGVTVQEVLPDAGGVTVRTDAGDYRAAAVVGADGSNGITRRCILPGEPLATARVLEVLTPPRPAGGGQASAGREGTAYFDFFPVPQNISGYVWDFPTQRGGAPMRCWGVYDANLLASERRPALKDPLGREMERIGFHLDEYRVEGHPIRWYTPWNTAAVPRVLFAGDAVGADPIFGEGISLALGYGALAARELSASFRRGDFSFRGYRRRLARSSLGQTLLARWLIAQLIYPMKWKWFQFLLWRILKPVVVVVAWTLVLNWSKRLK